MEVKPIKDKHFPDSLYRILRFLSRRGSEVELSDIREEFKREISKPVIKAILYDLSLQNFIKETTARRDRRKKIIHLTEAGGKLLQKLEELDAIM
ncbi:MAG: hypothetical protein ACTSRS_01025 [Candidatus Helarchaeota archaeon]